MTNTFAAEKTLSDNELVNISGGDYNKYLIECKNCCFCYNIGDVVEVFTWLTFTVRCKIVDTRWNNDGHPEYKVEPIEDMSWCTKVIRRVPTWVNSKEIQ